MRPPPAAILPALSLLLLTDQSQATCPDGANLDTKGILYMQKRAELNTVQPPEASQPSPEPPVFLTYCNAAFQRIFEVFFKCYEAAMGGGMVPHLLDLGGEDAGRCRPAGPDGASLLTAAAVGGVTPQGVPLIIAKGIADQLEAGRDVFRIDADAFIMKSPIGEMRDRYPNADVVSSIDCVYDGADYCGWYRTPAYHQRHGGLDPLADLGFMLNTGFALFRSNPRTVALARDAERAVRDGRSDFEQTALNEELVRRNCRWSTAAGELHSRPEQEALYRLHFFGLCNFGLRVVVLPYDVVTRDANNATGKLAVHPGGTTEFKLTTLPEITRACAEAAGSQTAAV